MHFNFALIFCILYRNEHFLNRTIFSGESPFHVFGRVNKHKVWIWCSEKSSMVRNNVEVDVCVTSRSRLTSSAFSPCNPPQKIVPLLEVAISICSTIINFYILKKVRQIQRYVFSLGICISEFAKLSFFSVGLSAMALFMVERAFDHCYARFLGLCQRCCALK